ncbi:MAG TPA: penicillin-binding protein 2 [Chloroflexota bacterium]|nr:penicillin-binding protein 2 [Chloroflexota bacterium]
MERQIRNVGLFFLACFTILSLGAGYWQVWRGPALAAAAGNPRVQEAEKRALRGRILDRDGEVLAKTENGEREYPKPLLAHATGYYSYRYGSTGVERAFDRYLGGKITGPDLNSWVRRLAGGTRVGADVRLTLDADVQTAADHALGDRQGAVVALDVETGAVLAMLSKPYFNPGLVDEEWARLSQDESRPLYNRVSQGLYVPGSTFKVITAAAALDSGLMQTSTMVSDPTGESTVDGFRITDAEKPPIPTFDFAHAFAWSSNVVFADVGLKLGEPRLREYASRFGIGKALPFELETSPTSLTRKDSMSRVLLASTAFGQGELLISPLQMAVVAATVARNGDVPRPFVVDEVRAPSGTVLYRGEAVTMGRATSPETARALRNMMTLAVEEGFGRNAAIPGVRVAGKTGTAQSVPGLPDHSWFIGFAPAGPGEQPRVAVAVIVEYGGWGSLEAAPVARRVMQAALAAQRR